MKTKDEFKLIGGKRSWERMKDFEKEMPVERWRDRKSVEPSPTHFVSRKQVLDGLK